MFPEMRQLLSFAVSVNCCFFACSVKTEVAECGIEQGATVPLTGDNTIVNRRILFGHQSVGENILKGVALIAPDVKQVSLTPNDSALYSDKGILHFKVGQNREPIGKIDHFRKEIIDRKWGGRVDLAVMKFCYIDFDKSTDIKKVFEYYVSNIDIIKNVYPDLSIVHCTVPITVHRNDLRSIIRNMVRGDVENIKRCEFNSMLVQKYKGSDPLFDIACIESSIPNDGREVRMFKGKKYYTLFKGYTYDGAHLNENGQNIAAKKFLQVLQMSLAKKQVEPNLKGL
jgi:hypothetical protein